MIRPTPLRAIWGDIRPRRARARAGRIAVVTMAALALSAALRAQSFSIPIDISGPTPGGQPVIGVDAKNNIDIAWPTNKGIFFTRSTDRGRTFTAPATISATAGSGAAQLDVDRNGGIYLLWQGTDMHFWLSRSTDGGSFSSPADLTAALNMDTSSGGVPAMALDTNGGLDLVWTQPGRTGSVMFARSTDGGVTFSNPVEVGRFVYGAKAQIAPGPQGDINILWSDQSTNVGDTCALRFNRSTDSGATFSSTMTLSAADGGCDAKLVVDSQTNVGTVVNSLPDHDILFSRSRGQGIFSSPILVGAAHPAFASGGGTSGENQSIAVDSSGNVNVLWQDDILTPGAPDIFLSRSTNGGASFSTAQNVSQSPGASNPQMAVDSAGNIDIVWAAAEDRKVVFSQASVSTGDSALTISATPASLVALAGGTATANVTLTTSSGFGQVVSLGCGKLPPGALCSFTPPSMTLGTASTAGTVTVSVPPTLSTGSFPFTVNATTPTISQFLNMQISVGAMTGSVTPRAMTIPVGASASFSVTVASTGGFGGQVGLICSAPVGVKCQFNPSSAFLPINGTTSSILTVLVSSTPAAGSALKDPQPIFPRMSPGGQIIVPISALIVVLFSGLTFAWLRRSRIAHVRTAASIVFSVGLIAALGVALVSCGGARTKETLGSGGFTVGTGGTSGISGTGGTGGMGGTGGSAGAGGTASGGVTTIGSTSVTFPLTVLAQAGASAINVGTVTVTVP